MTKTSARADMYARIERHGRQLLAIFPNATIKDPVELCKRLRRIETLAASIGLQLCNGPEMTEAAKERRTADALKKANALLGNSGEVPVFINLDPRGYALKIDDEWLRAQRADHRTAYKAAIHQDWGGYGIIAPDLRNS